MLTDDEMRDIDQVLKSLKIMWIGFLIASVFYLIFANVIGTEYTVADKEDPEEALIFVGYILYAIAAIDLLLAYFFRRAITNPKGVISRFSSPRLKSNLTPTATGKDSQLAKGRYLTGIVMCFAQIHSIAIFGLIIFVMNADYFSLYLLFGISVAALVYFRPKKQEVIDLTMQLKHDNQM